MNDITIQRMRLTIVLLLLSFNTYALPIVSSDFDGLSLGAKIAGPVGPEVETSLVNSAGQAIGDLASSVSCPPGAAVCSPGDNALGTIYTYVHEVIPGIDLLNDGPFPNPDEVIPFDNISDFSLGFSASGFNGVAGYSFTEAATAQVNFDVEISDTGILRWVTDSSNWGSNEKITFFWQTTQAPVGTGGSYGIANAQDSGFGAGPLPMAIEVAEPNVLGSLVASLFIVFAFRVRDKQHIHSKALAS
ncbi:hypothetical protein [Paraglaciecola polaris]|uniref:Exosortase, PEP-CTERM interaction domain protein n=1 Tax=Paraglaciecola polaris LMG 21857 TaxID=1129793 RepID=K6YE10_9ALTE|nr:hypothetical protein [Paraglaciecola polaris]GAC30979.1 hypothetical protein GPLA_0058 [Paraglaciecola polaris LMG 21857]